MLKFKYEVKAISFPDIKAFQAYLNEMGNKGYELIQWQQVFNVLPVLDKVQDIIEKLNVIITWKIENHDS